MARGFSTFIEEVSDDGKNADLFREVSQAVSLAVVTTNCEKSAEAIVGKKNRRAEQCNRVIKCMLHGIPDSRNGET